jgi:plasmid maintenance system antidote protein VapI
MSHGQYDWRHMATLHRPTDQAGITAAAHALASTGLTIRDIATTLGLTEQAVSQLLRETAALPSKEISNDPI